MTTEERLASMSEEELLALLQEAEELYKTGMLPETSKLRALTGEVFHYTFVAQMTAVSFQIYRLFALRNLKH